MRIPSWLPSGALNGSNGWTHKVEARESPHSRAGGEGSVPRIASQSFTLSRSAIRNGVSPPASENALNRQNPDVVVSKIDALGAERGKVLRSARDDDHVVALQHIYNCVRRETSGARIPYPGQGRCVKDARSGAVV